MMGVLLAIGGGLLLLALVVFMWARRGFSAEYDYDVLVIGGGAAGLTAASMAAHFGARTLLIEREKLGGDCTWHGCVPSKALLGIAEHFHSARVAARYGGVAAEEPADLSLVWSEVRRIQAHIYEEADSPEVVRARGIELLSGDASFVSPHAVRVQLGTGETREVSFRLGVICTGTTPFVPPIPGLAESGYLTNESLFRLPQLPKRLLVVGGGPIGCEISQAFSRLGSKVTLVQRGEQLLAQDEAELAGVLQAAFAEEGIDVLLQREVKQVARQDGQIVAVVSDSDGQQIEVKGDALLIATGRKPVTDALGLQAAGVKSDGFGSLEVDQHGRTSTAHIYAVGDIAGGPKFTHWAEHSAKTAMTHALLGVPAKLRPQHLPWVTYTEPEFAHCGLTRAQLVKAGRSFETFSFPYEKLDRAVTQGRSAGQLLVYANKGKILGASVAGAAAGELISELGLAMQNGLSLKNIADSLHAYPTFSLGVRQLADQWYRSVSPEGFLRWFGHLRGFRGKSKESEL